MFRLLKGNTIKKKHGSFATKGGEVLSVKCSLCERNHDLDDCNLFLQFDLQKRSKWLFQHKFCYGCFREDKGRKERNAKFVRKDTQHLCMVIRQRKVRLSSQRVTP